MTKREDGLEGFIKSNVWEVPAEPTEKDFERFLVEAMKWRPQGGLYLCKCCWILNGEQMAAHECPGESPHYAKTVELLGEFK